ncbi:MAG: hypothetical protein GF364_07585 [Candidatus Lokiarchaeota archaeon]|nr:hypothetical protein [Candidatus Lokiarchaeota archaeon]
MNLQELLPNIEKKNEIFVTAHRGANAECPENTILSFKTAIDIGADLIEMDIHKSRDDQIIVMHDGNTRRTSNISLNISESTLDELKKADLGEGQTIPILDEVFENFKGKVGFVIEIKAKGLTNLLKQKIEDYNLSKDCIIISFKHGELKKFRKISPDVPIAALNPSRSGWLSSWFFRKGVINRVKKMGFEGTHPFHKLVDDQMVIYAHSNNIFVNPWTVDNIDRWKELLAMKVDGITTNDPRNLIKLLSDIEK